MGIFIVNTRSCVGNGWIVCKGMKSRFRRPASFDPLFEFSCDEEAIKGSIGKGALHSLADRCYRLVLYSDTLVDSESTFLGLEAA